MINCYEDFIGISKGCNGGETSKSGLFIDSLEEISVKNIAKIVSDEPNAVEFIKSKLEFATKEYAAYLLAFFDEGEPVCLADCKFDKEDYSALETANLGVTYSAKLSALQEFSMTCIKVKSKQAGAVTITVTDGDQTQTVTPTLVIGENIVDLSFTSRHSEIHIFADGSAHQFGELDCGQTIGCSKCHDEAISVTGYKDGSSASKAYGFIPDLCLVCNEDRVKCAMLHQAKEGALYYAGVKILEEWQASDRLNYLILGSEEWIVMKKEEWAQMAKHFTEGRIRTIGNYLRRLDPNCYKCQGITQAYSRP